MSRFTATPASLRKNPAATPVPLLDVKRQYDDLGAEFRAAIDRVCRSGRFVGGPDCEALEQEIATYCQARHAIGCASGSDAILLALMALDIGPGDEVILPSYTFFATASAVWRVGAKIVFCDIDPTTFNLDAEKFEPLITPATKAIIPVHLFGECVEMKAIEKVAWARGLAIIEDAAQAIGAEYAGRRAGSLGDIGCFSFYPTKNLGACGDGGMLTTGREDLAQRLRLFATHGMSPRYYHQVVGINSRLDTIQAAILRVKLPHLDRWTEMREANADHYESLFQDYRLDRILQLPRRVGRNRHVWNQYVIRVPDGRRDALRQRLTDAQVGTEIYYPVPLHLQECFRSLGHGPKDFPESERAAQETLALPIYPELTGHEQRQVVEAVHSFFADGDARKLQTVPTPRVARRKATEAAEATPAASATPTAAPAISAAVPNGPAAPGLRKAS
jgi:dTDP-4-amino-4,6-dideoxygalactose transaminase